jgi:soluble lytic murein transglycosylase
MFKMVLRTFIILFFISNAAMAGNPFSITPKDKSALEKALYFINKEQIDMARFEASKAEDADILKLVLWLQYQKQYPSNSYREIADFVQNNPNWPTIKKLNNNAEEALDNNVPASTIISYFTDKPPVTGHGMIVLAEAKIQNKGSTAEINKLLSQGWIKGDFSKSEEEDILQNYGHRLTLDNHIARTDRLLWEDKIDAAKRMVGKLDSDHKSIFVARIKMMEGKKGLQIAVDSEHKNDLGIMYEQIKSYEERNDFERAYNLLSTVKGKVAFPEKWWDLKSTVIRDLLKDKQYSLAYNLTQNHGNEAGSEDYAEAEWLAGWIAMEFLGDAKSAYDNFYNIYNNTSFPVSKSRGAYWAARAAAKLGQTETSDKWYNIAAQYITTFYGQLAYMKANPNSTAQIPNAVYTSEIKNKVYRNNELLKCAYLLHSVDEPKLAETFVIAAINSASSPEEMAVISEIGKNSGRMSLAVLAAKHALRKNVVLSKAGWPVIENIPTSVLEKPLVLGLIRQESSFDPNAKSPSNAMGLMQLLPSTAKEVAKKIGIAYKSDHLQKAEYNITLGSDYLRQLIERFDGSYILAIASYNAGAGNVRKWINNYGDPRELSSPEAVLNWIESIPFSETRSYVQRVLENTEVYRNKLNGTSFALDEDLLRGKM